MLFLHRSKTCPYRVSGTTNMKAADMKPLAYALVAVATAGLVTLSSQAADILWRNAATGETYVYSMNGTSIVSEGYLRTVADPNWKVAGVGDFNGGGTADILWRNSATGENYLYLMNGTSIVGEGYLRTVADPNWKVVGGGDV